MLSRGAILIVGLTALIRGRLPEHHECSDRFMTNMSQLGS